MLLKTIIKWVWDVLALRWEGQEAWGPWKGRWSRSTFNFPVTIFALPQTPLLWSAGRPLHGQVGADYPAGSSFPSSTVIREGAGACTYTLCVFGKVVTPLRPNLPYLWGMPVVAGDLVQVTVFIWCLSFLFCEVGMIMVSTLNGYMRVKELIFTKYLE